jgi:response regulator RpfG family c-di-GMP phosphodiesterase
MTSITFFFLHTFSVIYIIPKVSDGQQQMQHYKLVMQVLNKRHLNHIESFKKALKLHSEHVQQRQKRVGKDIKLTNETSYLIMYCSKTEL